MQICRPVRHAGGSPFASAVASLLPERVEGLVLVCPLAPMFGREGELYEGGRSSACCCSRDEGRRASSFAAFTLRSVWGCMRI